MLASSRSPWIVPSSPYVPCRTGNTTSSACAAPLPPSAATPRARPSAPRTPPPPASSCSSLHDAEIPRAVQVGGPHVLRHAGREGSAAVSLRAALVVEHATPPSRGERRSAKVRVKTHGRMTLDGTSCERPRSDFFLDTRDVLRYRGPFNSPGVCCSAVPENLGPRFDEI